MSHCGKIFLRALVTAIPKISAEYFQCPTANRRAAEDYVVSPHRIEKAFRFGERLFCYELYHQLRISLAPLLNSSILTLHGELQKPLLEAMAGEQAGARRLDKKYIPDFILHGPGRFDNQEVMMEVKTNPNWKFAQIYYDLKKIDQFIDRYKYKMGVFLAVNVRWNDLLDNLLKNKVKLQVTITYSHCIHIVVCNGPDEEVFHTTLGEVLK